MPLLDAPAITLNTPGLLDYQMALNLQRDLHAQVVSGATSNTLILLEHPSVFTAGSRTIAAELPADGTPVIRVDRGGKITWHGPGQLVGYPIVKLRNPRELVGFVREIESALIALFADLGVQTHGIKGRSGVWVSDLQGPRKLAAIGIRVASGVSMHGFAINVNPDLSNFSKIIPCGISDADVTSLSRELGRDVTVSEILPKAARFISEYISKVSS